MFLIFFYFFLLSFGIHIFFTVSIVLELLWNVQEAHSHIFIVCKRKKKQEHEDEMERETDKNLSNGKDLLERY